MESPAVRKKLDDDENKSRQQAGAGNLRADMRGTGGGKSYEADNSRFISNQRLVTQEVIAQQDNNLEALDSAVDRLHNMGGAINQELKEQNLMLDKLDSDMDDAGEKMNFVLERLGKLLKTKDGCQIMIIVVLVIILVILITLVVYLP